MANSVSPGAVRLWFGACSSPLRLGLCLGWVCVTLAGHGALAQGLPQAAASAAAQPEAAWSLQTALDAAWQRQPELKGAPLRRAAAQSMHQAASARSPEPAAIEASTRTDRFTGNRGSREYEIGVSVPLWLPNEKQQTLAVAQSEIAGIDSRLMAAQWRLAGAVRAAWWTLQGARQDALAAQQRLLAAQALAADVRRRVIAGDLARADQNQAEGVVASAQADVAGAQGTEAEAAQALRGLVGQALPNTLRAEAEAEPAEGLGVTAEHPALREWADKAQALRRVLALTQTQTRGNPEISVRAARERGGAAEAYGHAITLGLRVPLGNDDRSRAKTAIAAADLAEAEATMELEHARLEAELDAAIRRVAALRQSVQANERRADLARQTQGFIDKAYRAGEADLPTRLRIEAEASDAARQAQRARVELHRAISSWRHIVGLLPG